jgi:hypothetical protein
MVDAVDYSWAHPDSTCLAQHGVRAAIRYTCITDQGAKNLRKPEADRLLDAGLDIVIVFEESKSHILGGPSAGTAAAKASWQAARDAGAPVGIVHYFALDVDPAYWSSSQWNAAGAYLDAAAAYLRPKGDDAGLYGPYSAIERFVPGTVAWGWQCYAWSGGQKSPKRCLYQYDNENAYCGGTVDYDDIVKEPYGGWRQAGVPPPEDLSILDAETREYLDHNFQLVRVGDVSGGAADPHDYSSVEGVGRKVDAVRSDLDALVEQVATLDAQLGEALGILRAGTGAHAHAAEPAEAPDAEPAGRGGFFGRRG